MLGCVGSGSCSLIIGMLSKYYSIAMIFPIYLCSTFVLICLQVFIYPDCDQYE